MRVVCATVDNELTKKIDDLEEIVEDIKDDRTVIYRERDIKLKSALEFLKKNNFIDEINIEKAKT